jgi:nicotinamidase/pyrazinamidase
MEKSANIVFLIDIQNGFARSDLTPAQGGTLYVPDGERAGEPAARLMRNSSDTVFILSQDYHPADHISFASNHAGAEPYSTINLARGAGGHYQEVAGAPEGSLSQTLWLDHCIQGTESALFVPEIMAELPARLSARLVVENDKSPTLYAQGERGNEYFVVRKGMRSDLDSYGISTENDKKSKTQARLCFLHTAHFLNKRGITTANIYLGGLATNFCVEYSHADIYKDFVPLLKGLGIEPRVHILSDISYGIPLSIPGGAWPDHANAFNRMAAYGTKICTTDDIIRSSVTELTSIKKTPTPEVK